MADCSALPFDLLGSVTGLLGVADQARLAAVCKEWRKAMADEFTRRPPSPSVWFLLPRRRDDGSYDGVLECPTFSDDGDRTYVFSVPCTTVSSHKLNVIGTSQGRVIMEDELSRLYALNPLTKTTLAFPPISGAHFIKGLGSYRKAVFVPNKPGRGAEDRPAVFVLKGGKVMKPGVSELAFAVAGDDAWTELATPPGSHFEDIAVADDGKLYALVETSEVMVFDLNSWLSPSSSSASSMETLKMEVEPDFHAYCKSHIGVIAGELILVRWWICMACPFRLRRCLPEYEVLKLHKPENKKPEWVTMKDLAGHAIILGDDGFLALPVKEFPQVERNRIYAIDSGGGYEDVGLTVVTLGGTALVSSRSLSPPRQPSGSYRIRRLDGLAS
ncbi:uncharacterized protein LOC144701454 [Wolffia australiana]